MNPDVEHGHVPETDGLGATIRYTALDVVGVFSLLVLAAIVFTLTQSVIVRAIVGIPVVLFLPGYALLLLLYPQRSVTATEGVDAVESISGPVRIALAYGISLAIVPLHAIGLAVVGAPFDPATILTSLGGLIAVLTVLGELRRRRLPTDRRFLPLRRGLAAAPKPTMTGLVIGIIVLVSLSTLTYAMVLPNQGERYSALYLLTPSESGTPSAEGFPASIPLGESQTLVVGVDNHEGVRTNYTVVVELHEVRTTGASPTTVRARELGRYQATVAPGETWRHRHTVTPTFSGDQLRLTYLLYRDSPPSDPSTETAYRTTYLWIDVPGQDTRNQRVSRVAVDR